MSRFFKHSVLFLTCLVFFFVFNHLFGQQNGISLERYWAPSGGVIVNALPPAPGLMPENPGELALQHRDQASQARSDYYAVAGDTVRVTVGKAAYPNLVARVGTADPIVSPGDTVTLEYLVSNLGNAPDDYTLSAEVAGVESPAAWETVIYSGDQKTEKLENIQPLFIPGVSPDSVVVRVHVPDNFDFENTEPRIILTAKTGQPESAYRPPYGRRTASDTAGWDDFATLQFLDLEGQPATVFEGDQTVGIIRAYRPGFVGNLLKVSLESSESGSAIELELERVDQTDYFESLFAITEGPSEVKFNPLVNREITHVKVERSGVTLMVSGEIGFVSRPVSTLAAWEPEAAPDYIDSLDAVRSWPSPYKPDSGEPFIFQNLPADRNMEIYFYNIQGQLVSRLSQNRGINYYPTGNSALWWGENTAGTIVSSGVYIYVIQSKYGVERGKVTLVR